MHPTQYETLLQKTDGLTNEIIQLRTEIETLKKSTRKTKKSPQSFPTSRNWQTVFQITQQFSDDFMQEERKQPEIQIRV
jgi:antitoxin VapB